MNRSTSIRLLGPALLVLVLVLGACAAGSGEAALERPDAGEPGGASAPGPADGSDDDGGVGEGPASEDPNFTLVEQRIVKTGEITLEVVNVAETLGRVRALVAELNGYVGGSQAGTLEDRATLTARIPAPAFDTALARLHELDAEVIAEATRENDVTSQVVDLAARIDNLRASEASYRELVARAEEIEDILAVQSRLDSVRAEIEQLTAQLDALEGQAALSTLTITIIPRAEPVEAQAETWDPGAQLDRALATLVGIGQGLLDGLIWFGVVWLPVLLVLSTFALLALRGVLEVRRRLPSSAPAEGGGDHGAA